MFCCCTEEQPESAQVIDVSPIFEDSPLAGKVDDEAASPEPGKQVEERVEVQTAPAAVEFVSSSFVANLSRQGSEPLGLKADFSDEKVVHICRVTADGNTAIARYNASAPDGQQLEVGDYFVAVNGVSYDTVQSPQKVSDALREQLQNSRSMSVEVRRQELFECTVERNGQPMGLELSYSTNRLGDRIVRIGDTEGSPEQLLEAIRNAKDTLPLLISRPAAG